MTRYLFGFICVLALGVMPMVGCGKTEGAGGSGGSAGTGGEGGGGGNGVACVDSDCPCTEAGIRAAIAEGGGPFTFSCDGPQTVVTEAEIVIDNTTVILDGEGNLTVSGAEERWPLGPEIHRVFGVQFGANVTLDGITVTLGSAAGFGLEGMGGGLLIFDADVTLRNSTVLANRATESGGGIAVIDGTLTLIDSTVMGNFADRDVGGGIAYAEATVTLSNSTVSRNAGVGIGPVWTGARDGLGGTITLTNSTVSGHGAAAAIELDGASLTLTNSTASGGGIRGDAGDGTTTMTNSIVSSLGGCGAHVVSNGYNIESPGDTCGLDQPTDQVNVSADDVKLGELADNGGPTMTHALLPGSVAIDVIPADMCEVDEDQRGQPRDTMCDVGAFEAQP